MPVSNAFPQPAREPVSKALPQPPREPESNIGPELCQRIALYHIAHSELGNEFNLVAGLPTIFAQGTGITTVYGFMPRTVDPIWACLVRWGWRSHMLPGNVDLTVDPG